MGISFLSSFAFQFFSFQNNYRSQYIEENNRIGKTRDLFKIIRDTKGTFHAKMGSIKDRNGMVRRDKKSFLNDQRKEIEDNNRMGKTRDLFKKIRDTKGTFLCKDGHNKGQKWYGPNRSRRY